MSQSTIPIRNLYYLLCYSWDNLEQGELVDVSRCPTTELVDLFALVLCTGINHLARRGLEQGYEQHVDELTSPRGKIDALGSARRFLVLHGRAVCQYDELTVNTPSNQILKGTLSLLSRSPDLNARLRADVERVLRSLEGISAIRLSPGNFGRVQLHSNTRFYRFLLNVCELVVRHAIVSQDAGAVRFRDFLRDERTMARVFEQFLFNFIMRHGAGLSVKRDRITWNAHSSTDPELSMLPSMNTDISVYRPGLRLIIDAKYYGSSVSVYRDTTRYHSANLYQLMSYLSNASFDGVARTQGMLIYPRVDRTLRDKYVIQGYPVTIATVDLNRDWTEIHAEVLEALAFGLDDDKTVQRSAVCEV